MSDIVFYTLGTGKVRYKTAKPGLNESGAKKIGKVFHLSVEPDLVLGKVALDVGSQEQFLVEFREGYKADILQRFKKAVQEAVQEWGVQIAGRNDGYQRIFNEIGHESEVASHINEQKLKKIDTFLHSENSIGLEKIGLDDYAKMAYYIEYLMNEGISANYSMVVGKTGLQYCEERYEKGGRPEIVFYHK